MCCKSDANRWWLLAICFQLSFLWAAAIIGLGGADDLISAEMLKTSARILAAEFTLLIAAATCTATARNL